MKKPLQKIFFQDSPPKGAFWSLVLLLLGSWLLGTLFFFCHGIFALTSFLFAVSRRGWSRIAVDDCPWQLAAVPVFLFLVIHFIVQQYRVWRCCRGKKAASFRKWLGLAALLWLGTVLCWAYGIGLAVKYIYHDGGFLEYLREPAWSLPYWAAAALLLLSGSVLATGKVYSLLGHFPYRDIFTLPVKILAGTALAVYVGLVAAALSTDARCEAEKAMLGKHFNRPLTAEALQEMICRDRKADGNFWKEVDALLPGEKPPAPEIGHCFAEFSPEQLAAWRKKFTSSPEFARLDRMLNKPLPAYPRKFERYKISLILLGPELHQLRSMARLQVWHIRFAVAEKDRAAAVAALQRMDHLSDYLAAEPFLIHALVKMAIDTIKVRALERLLAAQILNRDDLLALKRRCRAVREQLAAMERSAVWSEALLGADFMEACVHAETAEKDQRVVPWEKLRFLLPQGWLFFEGNRLNLLRFYRDADKFRDLPEVERDSLFSCFAAGLTPSFKNAGERFLKSELEQRAIEFFMDQELYRLEHGELPEALPPPLDPFSRQPMHYTHGMVEETREVYEKNEETFRISARRLCSPTEGHCNVTVTIPDAPPPTP